MPEKFSNHDVLFMKEALRLAALAKGQTSPNPAVGALIVKDDKIIASGFHKRAGLPHAEAEALKKLRWNANGATLYVTLEPCSHFGKTPPCADAVIAAGITEVVAAMKDPFPKVAGGGFKKLRDAGVKVRVGLLRKEAVALNEDFISFHTKKRPFIHLKWAMSLDGRTSTDSGDSKWISNEESRRYAHLLRSYCDAVLVGANTMRRDDPELNVRLPKYKGKQPLRIILDETLNINPQAKIFGSNGGDVLIFTSAEAVKKKAGLIKKIRAKIIGVDANKCGVSLIDVVENLKALGVQSIFVEGGRSVAGAFLEAKFADKITAFVSPVLIGGNLFGAPILTRAKSGSMTEAVRFSDVQIKNFGADMCIEGYPVFL